MPLFFWFHLLLEARAEIKKNNFIGFLVQMRTRKFAFEINWPLRNAAQADSHVLYCKLARYVLSVSARFTYRSFRGRGEGGLAAIVPFFAGPVEDFQIKWGQACLVGKITNLAPLTPYIEFENSLKVL